MMSDFLKRLVATLVMAVFVAAVVALTVQTLTGCTTTETRPDGSTIVTEFDPDIDPAEVEALVRAIRDLWELEQEIEASIREADRRDQEPDTDEFQDMLDTLEERRDSILDLITDTREALRE